MSAAGVILLAAGGTGGHLFPADALAAHLARAGYRVHLATDARARAYVEQLGDVELHTLSAASVFGGNPLMLPFRLWRLVWGFVQAFGLLWRLAPDAVVGFGGYPSFAPVCVALLWRKPALVHEQNAVLGRANRVLAWLGACVATSFPETLKVPSRARARTRRTGNPLRRAILDAARGGYRYLDTARPFSLLVFGGSQGASIFASVVPEAVGLLPEALRARLRIVQQARRDDMKDVLSAYGAMEVYAEIRDFFDDMPTRMRRAHLVICRAGATTVSELAVLNVPSVLVPLPGALDDDQTHNARGLKEAGGAWVMPQSDFTPPRLATKLEDLMRDEAALRTASKRTAALAQHDAAERLCRFATCLAQRLPVQIETADGGLAS